MSRLSTTRRSPELSSEPSADKVEKQSGPAKWPAWWMLGLQLAALWCLGLVRPLFDVLDGDVSFFVARGNTSGDILIFAIGITFIPPLVLTLIELVVRAFSKPASRVVHLVFVGLLAAIVALQFVKGPFSTTFVAFALSLAIGALIAWAFWTKAGMRTFLSVITPAPFIFLALFIFASPLSDLIIPSAQGTSISGLGGSQTPVVIVIYDEMPAAALMNKNTSIDAERFPNFAKLSETSTWYKNDMTVSDGTWSAVPAVLTGIRPTPVSQQLTSYPQSVYTMLAASHRVKSIEALTPVCPPSICRPKPRDPTGKRLNSLLNDLTVVAGRVVLPQQLADKLPAIGSTDGDFADVAASGPKVSTLHKEDPKARFVASPPIRELAGAAFVNDNLRQIAKLQNGISGKGRPPLYVMHVLMPHVPWRFGPTGDQYLTDGGDAAGLADRDGGVWTKNKYMVDVGLQRFLIQAEYSDRVLGSVITRMKQAGIWDRALFIMTADHGVSFRPGGSRRPVTDENMPEIANTPLFVKLPGQKAGKVDLKLTRSLDIVPTIAQVTKTGEGLKFDGVPLSEEPTSTDVYVRNGRQEKFIHADFADVIRRRDQLAREWAALFPPGRDGLYRLGPNQELIGKQVASLPQTTTTASAQLDNSELYSRLQPGLGVKQIYLTGSISGANAGLPLAAAVNGTIAAVGQSVSTPRGIRVTIILPPQSLSGKSARVELFSVSGGQTLAPLGSAGG